MNRRNFLVLTTATGILTYFGKEAKQEEQEEGTVIWKMKIEGKTYALGYRLTEDVDMNVRAMNWLKYAAEQTLRSTNTYIKYFDLSHKL